MKKIIIALLVGIIILGIVFIVILMNRSTNTGQTSEALEPTGIIVPTAEIQNNELDIVNIDPKDNTKNINTNKQITITFSRTFSLDEIIFNMSPQTPHEISINENKLVITPVENWNTGTIYSYSIDFIEDNQKVRLYSFTTSGAAQEYLPDTEPEGSYESLLNSQKEEDPDMYVANNTPYENNFFLATSEYESAPPAHFYLIITGKTPDQAKVQQEVNIWLQTLDLSTEQINSLDIRYQ